jgi:hypothetical protein
MDRLMANGKTISPHFFGKQGDNEVYNGIISISIDQIVTELGTKKAHILPCERSCETCLA